MRIDKNELIERIRIVFNDVPRPAKNNGIYTAEAWDDYRDPTEEEKEKDRRLRWPTVTIQDMTSCPAALSHLKPDGFHHYLPAYMTLTLKYLTDRSINSNAMDSTRFHLSPTDGESLIEYQEKRHGRLSRAQIQTVIDFIRLHDKTFHIQLDQKHIGYWKKRMNKLQGPKT